jgi:uncharacterized membrane protein HdeD (DUF308 family)
MEGYREIVREWIGYTVTSYWGGILWIILGIYGVIKLYKERNDEVNIGSGVYYLGWFGAIGMIILGISIIILKLLNKL